MAATTVWCNKCKTAVWAYDHMPDRQDIRGFLNLASIPCPACGRTGCFDGWSGNWSDVEETFPDEVYDGWSALKKIFSINVKDGIWAISPDCRWFNRPDMTESQYGDLMSYIQDGIWAGREE